MSSSTSSESVQQTTSMPFLRRQLTELINSLGDQGILDEYFQNHIDQSGGSLEYLLDTTTEFIDNVDIKIALCKQIIRRPIINYGRLSDVVNQLKECNTSFGGARVASACQLLQHACRERNKRSCLALFKSLETDYRTLRENLNRICMLARAILLPW